MSAGMIEHAKARGSDAQIVDLCGLPFEDSKLGVVCTYRVPARVLQSVDGGRVAGIAFDASALRWLPRRRSAKALRTNESCFQKGQRVYE